MTRFLNILRYWLWRPTPVETVSVRGNTTIRYVHTLKCDGLWHAEAASTAVAQRADLWNYELQPHPIPEQNAASATRPEQ